MNEFRIAAAEQNKKIIERERERERDVTPVEGSTRTIFETNF